MKKTSGVRRRVDLCSHESQYITGLGSLQMANENYIFRPILERMSAYTNKRRMEKVSKSTLEEKAS